MSKNKGFSSTSANRYSLALYELADESSSLDKVESNSSAFINLISSNNDFNNYKFKILLSKRIDTNNTLMYSLSIGKIFENFTTSFFINGMKSENMGLRILYDI